MSRHSGAVQQVQVQVSSVEPLRLDRRHGGRLPHGNGKVSRRRACPIMAYVGANGSGKTQTAVLDSLPSLQAGRLVYSTMPLLDRATGEPHRAYRPFSWEAFLAEEHCDFLLDEVIGLASSRESSSMSPEVQARLNQLRKPDIVVRWTAPAWPRADRILREVTQAVTDCRGYLSAHGEDGELWPHRRLFRVSTYDTASFDEWTAGRRERVDAVCRQWYWGPRSAARGAYDTSAQVPAVEPYDPARCPVCGLRRHTPYCKGHEDAAGAGVACE